MGINDLFDGSMKRIDQFAFALAEPRLQEKMQESRPGSEGGVRMWSVFSCRRGGYNGFFETGVI